MDNEEKIFRGYDWAYQRVHQFDGLLASRINIFLLSSSILFAGFVLLFSQLGEGVQVLIIIISVVGVILSIQCMFNQIRGVRELRYWLGVCRSLEREEDSFSLLREKELVYFGYMKWITGQKNKYTRENENSKYKAPPLTGLERKIISGVGLFHEWNTYRYVIPLVFVALWVAVLIWSL